MPGTLDSLMKLGKKRMQVRDSNVLTLTPLGSQKAEKFDLPGQKWRILTSLDENGPSTITEIASDTGTEPRKVRAIAKTLIGTGYIRKAQANE